jgi:hypothetical protein
MLSAIRTRPSRTGVAVPSSRERSLPSRAIVPEIALAYDAVAAASQMAASAPTRAVDTAMTGRAIPTHTANGSALSHNHTLPTAATEAAASTWSVAGVVVARSVRRTRRAPRRVRATVADPKITLAVTRAELRSYALPAS